VPPALNGLEWECGFVDQDGEEGWVLFGADTGKTCVPFTTLDFTGLKIQLYSSSALFPYMSQNSFYLKWGYKEIQLLSGESLFYMCIELQNCTNCYIKK